MVLLVSMSYLSRCLQEVLSESPGGLHLHAVLHILGHGLGLRIFRVQALEVWV